MRKFITTIILLILLYFTISYYHEIIQFLMINVIYKDEVTLTESNEYTRDNNYSYVSETDNLYPENKQDILNIFYTALNKGYNEFTFYCSSEYEECIDDVNDLINDETTLSNINNLVSIYNSYHLLYVNANSFGRVNVKIDKIYNQNDINKLDAKVNEIYSKIITDDMSLEDKIKAAHDYIINNTVYDDERANEIKNGVDELSTSNMAYGPLFTGKAICGGYTDAMALFLDKIGVPNFKLASTKHIWNVVYINDQWLHLDLTWDDPVVNTGENLLTHNYFLITTKELEEKKDGQHYFDEDMFKELKTD